MKVSPNRSRACDSAAETAERRARRDCKKRGWEWDGNQYVLVEPCNDCRKGSNGWACLAKVAIQCYVDSANALEVQARRKYALDLINHALPSLESALRVFARQRGLDPGYTQVVKQLRRARDSVGDVRSAVKRASGSASKSIAQTLDRVIGEMKSAIRSADRALQRCN